MQLFCQVGFSFGLIVVLLHLLVYIYIVMNKLVYTDGASVEFSTVYLYHLGRQIFCPALFESREQVKVWTAYVVKRFGVDYRITQFLREVVTRRASGSVKVSFRFRRDNLRCVLPVAPFLRRLHDLPLRPLSYRYDRAVGVELECVRLDSTASVELPYWAREVHDGSIRTNGVPGKPLEYNVLCVRRELEIRLYKICDLLRGHVVNKSCGLHVHLDCRGKSEAEVWALAKKVDAWLFALRELVPESRRANEYCKFGISRTDRYRAVNFMAFREHQTLEIRLHSGTVDYTKIISWVRLLELLLVIQSKPKAGWGCLQVLGQLPLCEYERSYWLQRHRALNPASYPSAVPSSEVE